MFDLEGLELCSDVSPAAWIEEHLRMWPPDPGFPVRGVIPEGFESYARILHPVWRQEGERWRTRRWADLAAERDKVAHPQVQFHALMDADPGRGDWEGNLPPEELPEDECRALSALLGPFTTASDRCWFCVWEGYGFLSGGSAYLLTARRRGLQLRRMRRGSRRIAKRQHRELADVPRVRTLRHEERGTAARSYFMFRGPLDAIGNLRSDGHFQSPNLWWPDDRARCVATEVDGFDTFVGGGRECIAAVLASPALEAFPIQPSDRVDARADTINGPPASSGDA